LTPRRVHIRGLGIISPLGRGVDQTIQALRLNLNAIRPLRLFTPASTSPLPVGEVSEHLEPSPLPRCHQLALLAAQEAMADLPPPDAVILGITTGGILTTEDLLQAQNTDPARYHYHSLASVGEEVARRHHCLGPTITISTACSSGTAAIILALEMIRAGAADRVLVGGVDSLCRLTYFGFHALQLVDAEGARPFAKERRGMSVAEGAAMLLLEADRQDGAVAEILGGGLSCDAYHPAAPHPQGVGAQKAMAAALLDAGLTAADIDYINLHGTGTPDNDQAEARAVHALFPHHPPPLSSIKGATGHTLGAAGAIEAVVAAIAVCRGLIPANTGGQEPDPALALTPLTAPLERPVHAVLSNSFGFGGNNASLVISSPTRFARGPLPVNPQRQPLAIITTACYTGAGDTAATMARLNAGLPAAGLLPSEEIANALPPRLVRRLKRLPRIALALSEAARPTGPTTPPTSVFMGTGWGSLSETHDFLDRLFTTQEQFPSPTDFVGSVHNGPASQVAIHFQATGPNLTTSAGNYSFEQALLVASLTAPPGEAPFFVLAADEYHPRLSPLFDPAPGFCPADGGGALCLQRNPSPGNATISCTFYQRDDGSGQVIAALIAALGGAQTIRTEYGLLLTGLPASCQEEASNQRHQFLAESGFTAPVIDYRRLTGEFATASAVAVVMAVNWLQQGHLPPLLAGSGHAGIAPKRALIIGFGPYVTAMEITAP
jgi:3-oxoacyl-[acyl-carrier-protein] synthase-1/3-oxoacyl-[acyl-carrier-protein] synthase II